MKAFCARLKREVREGANAPGAAALAAAWHALTLGPRLPHTPVTARCCTRPVSRSPEAGWREFIALGADKLLSIRAVPGEEGHALRAFVCARARLLPPHNIALWIAASAWVGVSWEMHC